MYSCFTSYKHPQDEYLDAVSADRTQQYGTAQTAHVSSLYVRRWSNWPRCSRLWTCRSSQVWKQERETQKLKISLVIIITLTVAVCGAAVGLLRVVASCLFDY